jgi:hypothetical protein
MKHFQLLLFVSYAVSLLHRTPLFFFVQLSFRLSLTVQYEICISSSSHLTPPWRTGSRLSLLILVTSKIEYVHTVTACPWEAVPWMVRMEICIQNFPLSAYCHISLHLHPAYTNIPKHLPLSKVDNGCTIHGNSFCGLSTATIRTSIYTTPITSKLWEKVCTTTYEMKQSVLCCNSISKSRSN